MHFMIRTNYSRRCTVAFIVVLTLFSACKTPPRVLLNDNVAGYTNQQFFNALDADINSLPNYRIRLLSENGNSQAAGVTTIFSFYED